MIAPQKVTIDVVAISKRKLLERLERATEKVIELIMDEYDDELVAVSNSNRQVGKVLDFAGKRRDEFIKRLEKFEFIIENRNNIKFMMPTMESFDLSGNLQIFANIFEGTMGVYYVVDGEEYEKIYGKRPINAEPLDEYMPKKDRLYLIKKSGAVDRKVRGVLKKNINDIRFPFSNTPPINILDTASDYVEDNMSDWVQKSIAESVKRVTKKYKGVR